MTKRVSIDRIHASWTKTVELGDYVEDYLRSRHYQLTEEACATIREFIGTYPGRPPCTKADMDYYLDMNAEARFGPILLRPRRHR